MLLLNLNQLLIVIIKLPRVNPQWGNLDNAILTIEKLLSLFSKGYEGYNRFAIFLQIFKTANSLSYTSIDIDNKYSGFLVFVYDVLSPSKDPYRLFFNKQGFERITN